MTHLTLHWVVNNPSALALAMRSGRSRLSARFWLMTQTARYLSRKRN